MEVKDLDLRSIDHVLSTTRAVRQRLDLERPVPMEVVHECLELALQAPTGFNEQNWRWLIISDPDLRREIGNIFRRVERPFLQMMDRQIEESDRRTRAISTSSWYLAEHLHEVPIHVIPCSTARIDQVSDMFGSLGYETDLENMAASAVFGELWPAAWSFMLALRSRGLGSSLTMIHLAAEPEVAELLNIPPDVAQAGLIPVAYFQGQDFRPATRRPLHEVLFYDRWGQTSPAGASDRVGRDANRGEA